MIKKLFALPGLCGWLRASDHGRTSCVWLLVILCWLALAAHAQDEGAVTNADERSRVGNVESQPADGTNEMGDAESQPADEANGMDNAEPPPADETNGMDNAEPPPADETNGMDNAEPPPADETNGVGNAEPPPADETNGVGNAEPPPADETNGVGNAEPPPADETNGMGNAEPPPADETNGMGNAEPQPGEEASGMGAAPQSAEEASGMGNIAPQSAGESFGFELPYSRILRNTDWPYDNPFRDIHLGANPQAKIGSGRLLLPGYYALGAIRLKFPLIGRGGRPENAELKIGRLYLDLYSLSGSLLYTDNANLTARNTKEGAISIVRLTGGLIFQIGEDTRLSLRGAVLYLPFRGKIGVEGFLNDNFGDILALLSFGPRFRSQLSQDLRVGGWNVEFLDDFNVSTRRFGAVIGAWGGSLDVGTSFDEEDRIGRYAYGGTTVPGAGGISGVGTTARSSRLGFDFREARNLVAVAANRLLASDVRMAVGGDHADFWYFDSGSSANSARLPRSSDSLYVRLDSEREEWRFKPFAMYRASRFDSHEWNQEARGGIQGPITENMELRAEAGWFNAGDSPVETYLARVSVRHTINPLTYQELQFRRDVTEPEESIADVYSYQLHHIFGEGLSGELYGSIGVFQDLRDTTFNGEEDRAGLRFTYVLDPRAWLQLSGAYARFSFDDPARTDTEDWVGIGNLYYRYTPTVRVGLTYRYSARRSEVRNDEFTENLVILTVTKSF